MLARLRNVKLAVVKRRLAADAPEHAADGLFVEHLWQNIDDPDEVLFLFRVTDPDQARESIARRHRAALEKDPRANLPTMIFLDEANVFAYAR